MMFTNALRFVMAVNVIVFCSYFLIEAFRNSPFAEVEDWGLFIAIMLGGIL